MNLLVAFSLLLQDNTAEDNFKKIEEAIGNAKTVSVTVKLAYSVKQEGEEAKSQEGVLTMLLKQGNKMHFTQKLPPKRDLVVVSDGSKVNLKSGSAPPKEREVPETLNEGLALMLARAAGAYEMFVDRFKYPADDEGGKWPSAKEVLQSSDIKQGQDDKEAKTLTYKLKLLSRGQKETTLDTRVWYDPKSMRLLKRTLTGKTEQGELAFTEIFEQFVLNADIPDEKFKLPADK